MNFFGLARRSVFRKPVKSILLLLIVFAISTLLLAGVASKNASIEVQDKTRQAIGAGFLLEKNAEYRTKRISELSEKIGEKDGELEGYHQEKVVVNGAEGWRGWTTNEFETLDIKDIEKLAKTNGIADYNITTDSPQRSNLLTSSFMRNSKSPETENRESILWFTLNLVHVLKSSLCAHAESDIPSNSTNNSQVLVFNNILLIDFRVKVTKITNYLRQKKGTILNLF